MASELIAAGVDRDRILSELYNCYRENRLRLMGYLLNENMEITPEGVALMILNKDIQGRFDFRQGESEGFVNLPLAIKEVRMSILLTEEDERFRVSIRSKAGTSANKCALRYFNGGGHEMAAGGKLFFPENIPSPKDAKAYILKVSEEYFAK
jgi:phosphoesterase RecJ-like protein